MWTFGFDEDSVKMAADQPLPTDALFLLSVGVFGLAGNLLVILFIFVNRQTRKFTNAFIIHHAILDGVRCLFCLPFAGSLIFNSEPPACAWFGGAYVVLMTASVLNIFAMVVMESAKFTDQNLSVKPSMNKCCVLFGVMMLWIAACIINLSTAFIAGYPDWNTDIGNCLFVYDGKTVRPYLLYFMFIITLSGACILAVCSLRTLYNDIKANTYFRLATLARQTMLSLSPSDKKEREKRKRCAKTALRRCTVIVAVTVAFCVCWLPLAVLTIIDPGYKFSHFLYKIFTIIAYSNGAINPIFYIFLHAKTAHALMYLVKCKFIEDCQNLFSGGNDDDDDSDDDDDEDEADVERPCVSPPSATCNESGDTATTTLSTDAASNAASATASAASRRRSWRLWLYCFNEATRLERRRLNQ